jgi:hypothetical protein
MLSCFLVQRRIRQLMAQVSLHTTAFRRLFTYFTKIVRNVKCSYHCKVLSYLDRDRIYTNTIRDPSKRILEIRFRVLSFFILIFSIPCIITHLVQFKPPKCTSYVIRTLPAMLSSIPRPDLYWGPPGQLSNGYQLLLPLS